MDEIYNQFKDMQIPLDIKLLPKLTKEDIVKSIKRKLDISKTFTISLNCKQFRANELQIHTADIGVNYIPDFDFSNLDEIDAWRKTCKLKNSLQQFENVDLVRCENWLHKVYICEALTLFEEAHKMLKPGGKILIEVLNLFSLMKELIGLKIDSLNLYKYEKTIFSQTDSTGIYYNRTIWTFDRFKEYLMAAKFSNIQQVVSI